jgi:crotonobetainyl-CoA:carnitine CoA-transferase CaiB-like acyl-CoA transferase
MTEHTEPNEATAALSSFADLRVVAEHRLAPVLTAAGLDNLIGDERVATAGVWWQLVQQPGEVLQDAQVLRNELLEDVRVSRDRTVAMIPSPFRVLGHREPGPARAQR